MPCSPAPTCTLWPLPGENFPQPDIGAVCPFSGTGAEELRNMGYYGLKFPYPSEKMAKYQAGTE